MIMCQEVPLEAGLTPLNGRRQFSFRQESELGTDATVEELATVKNVGITGVPTYKKRQI